MVASWLDSDLVQFVAVQGGLIQEPVHGAVVGRGDTAAELGRGALLDGSVLQVLSNAHFLTCQARVTSELLQPRARLG